MSTDYTMSVKIDLKKLYMKLLFNRKKFIRLHELAYELCVSPKTAGKIFSSMIKLGYVEKWASDMYVVKTPSKIDMKNT